jgi:protocatechuate 3,4-dioxygenase beta subunit
MERRDALRTMLMGIGTLSIPRMTGVAKAATTPQALTKGTRSSAAGCWITPDETQGPYYFDPGLVRQDIRDGRPGVVLDIQFTVIDEVCRTQAGVLVDIWQCDKDGCYSGYNQPTCNAIGQTFLRGTQVTDSQGNLSFRTIYPGWYPGRATHIHFKARSNTTTYKTSQFCLPEAANAAVYASPLYQNRGPNPISNQQDPIFGSPAPLHEVLLDVVGDPTNGYTGDFTIGLVATTTGVPGADAPGSANLLRLNAGQTPFHDQTTLHAWLPVAGYVNLLVHNMAGRRVRTLVSGWKSAGTFDASWDGRDDDGHELPSGVYIASLEHEGHQVATRLVHVK